jgi:hypothetical protein
MTSKQRRLCHQGQGCGPLRIHLTEDMIVTATENYLQRHLIIRDSSEAKQLRNWLTRRIEEEK